MIVPHQLNMSKAQMGKIKKGLPIQIKFSDMGADKGNIVIGLKDGNAKKLLSAFKKGKGCRMCMDEEELDYTMKEGSGISFKGLVSKAKNLGKKVEKGVVSVGNKVGRPAKQLISKVPAPIRNKLKEEALGVMKGVGDNLGKMVAEATGDDELGNMISSGVLGVSEELLEGKRLQIGSKVLPIAKKAVNTATDMIEDPQYKMVAKALVKKAGMGLYGKAGEGLSGRGLSGRGLSGGKILQVPKDPRRPRFEKGSQEAKDYMASIRAGRGMKILPVMDKALGVMGGKKGGNILKKIGREAKKVGSKAKKAVFGKRMSDEAEFLLPALGGIAGTTLGGLAGVPMLGGVGGTAGGKRLAEEMKKKGMGLRGRGRPPIKPASDVMTLSPYTSINAPAFNPFYPTNSFQNGGNGEHQ